MFQIMGRYKNLEAEEIDEFETRFLAEKMLSEYRMAFDSDWVLWVAE